MAEIKVTKVKEVIQLLDTHLFFEYPNFKVVFTSIIDYHTSIGISSQYDLEHTFIETKKINQYLKSYSNVWVNVFPDLISLCNLIEGDFDDDKICYGKRCTQREGIGLTVVPEGDIYWCSETIGVYGCLGNFKEGSFNEEKLKHISQRNVFRISECKKCIYRFICGAGCPLRISTNHGKWDEMCCGVFKNDFIMSHLNDMINV